MTDTKEVAEDLANRVKDLLQPAPRPQRGKKIGIAVGVFMVLAFLAALAWEIYQVPIYREVSS